MELQRLSDFLFLSFLSYFTNWDTANEGNCIFKRKIEFRSILLKYLLLKEELGEEFILASQKAVFVLGNCILKSFIDAMSFANDFSLVSYRKLKTEFATGPGGRYFFPDMTLFLAFSPLFYS